MHQKETKRNRNIQKREPQEHRSNTKKHKSQQKKTPIWVSRSTARPQADGELKKLLGIQALL